MITRLIALMSRLGLCAACGCIAGGITGMLMGPYLFSLVGHHMSPHDATLLGAGLGLIDWLAVLFLLVAVGRYILGNVLISSLFTSVVASIFAALVINATRAPLVSMLTGWVVGLIVGAILCRLCRIIPLWRS
jgi:hypothetical protein